MDKKSRINIWVLVSKIDKVVKVLSKKLGVKVSRGAAFEYLADEFLKKN